MTRFWLAAPAVFALTIGGALAQTTDTTISLDTGKRGPADYVMTVKGPLSSPTMSMRGGSN